MTDQTHEARLTNIGDVRRYIAAERAIFTLVSIKTGTRFTYQRWNGNNTTHFVSVLTGSDNTSDYTPLGKLWWRSSDTASMRLYPLKTPRITLEAPSWKALQWFLRKIDGQPNDASLPQEVEFWHSGRCSNCGRLLTTDESIERGMGPVCYARATS